MSYTEHCCAAFREARAGLGFGEAADRAALARLRRLRPRADATDRLEVAALAEVPTAMRLIRKLGLLDKADEPQSVWRLENAAAALGTLAPLREAGKGHPVAALRKTMSRERFVRLIRMESPAERLSAGRRLVSMFEGPVDSGRLGADLFLWNDRIRTAWAFRYHGAALPDAINEETGDAA